MTFEERRKLLDKKMYEILGKYEYDELLNRLEDERILAFGSDEKEEENFLSMGIQEECDGYFYINLNKEDFIKLGNLCLELAKLYDDKEIFGE